MLPLLSSRDTIRPTSSTWGAALSSTLRCPDLNTWARALRAPVTWRATVACQLRTLRHRAHSARAWKMLACVRT